MTAHVLYDTKEQLINCSFFIKQKTRFVGTNITTIIQFRIKLADDINKGHIIMSMVMILNDKG